MIRQICPLYIFSLKIDIKDRCDGCGHLYDTTGSTHRTIDYFKAQSFLSVDYLNINDMSRFPRTVYIDTILKKEESVQHAMCFFVRRNDSSGDSSFIQSFELDG